MEPEEQKWFDAALERAARAREKGVVVMLVRRQDSNEQADIVMTTADSPEMVRALYKATSSDGDED